MSDPHISAGHDMRVNIKSEADVFVSFAGLQTKTLSLSATSVDVTDLESPGQWRELLPASGIKSANIKGAGIFTDGASSQLARAVFFAQTLRDYQFILPGFGIIEGPFLMSELTYRGLNEGLAQYDVTLMSAGEAHFTPIS